MSTPDHESAPAPAAPATASAATVFAATVFAATTSAVPAMVDDASGAHRKEATHPAPPREFGGPRGPEPTRFGDWEKNGRCIDF
jgi:hypothetical protein